MKNHQASSLSKGFIQKQIARYRSWQYKNTFFMVLSLVLLFYFADSTFVKRMIDGIGAWGYFGAFLTGIFFVSTFTVVPAMLVLYRLAENYNIFYIAIFAGTGALVGDYLIFRFLKDRVFEELHPIFNKLGGNYLIRMFRTPFFAWLTPLVGAAIIASPLPDEVGLGFLGLSKLKNWQFILLSLGLNAVGIFTIIALSRIW